MPPSPPLPAPHRRAPAPPPAACLDAASWGRGMLRVWCGHKLRLLLACVRVRLWGVVGDGLPFPTPSPPPPRMPAHHPASCPCRCLLPILAQPTAQPLACVVASEWVACERAVLSPLPHLHPLTPISMSDNGFSITDLGV